MIGFNGAEEVVGGIVGVAFYAMFGFICAAIASSKGRSAVGWFFVGLFFPCIGLIIVVCMDDLNQQRARHDRLHKENRRLKEQVALDRQVSDRRHEDVSRRLDHHDRSLQIDTRKETMGRLAGGPPALPAGAVAWYYANTDQHVGPIDEVELAELWRGGTIRPDTLVWREGMDDWKTVSDLEDLRERLG